MFIALLVLLSLPIGWLVRPRLTAFLAYLAAFSLLFAMQTTVLLVEWAGGQTRVFGAFPRAPHSEVYSYCVVNLGFLVVGTGLLLLAARLASRRRTRAALLVAA